MLPSPASGRGSTQAEFEKPVAFAMPLVCSPSPACGRGAGGEGRRVASTRRSNFVEALALTPALSRKREREYPSGI
ncbi:hypothetical protein CBM2587_B100102 [Cupriavidus taiwanensis]|uniref:Uncharacterized protein n=1 Tax=Cupriavidus taiwanensis TaxID=164546 RepID=A0A375C120_9BURK|nr:hypothetical protein CBM2587_B100102 [Cupriavidus taiwanensis]